MGGKKGELPWPLPSDIQRILLRLLGSHLRDIDVLATERTSLFT